jgi:hypothetical protein
LCSVPDIVGSLKIVSRTQAPQELAMNVGLLAANCCDFIYYLSDNLTFAAGYDFISLPAPMVEWL